MTILRDVSIYFPKLKVPNAMFDKANPRWEVQLRTTDKAQLAEWRELGLKPKLAEDEETGGSFYKLNLTRKSKNTKTGEAMAPPSVVDAALKPIDPMSIGNGSVGHIVIKQYDTTMPDGTPTKGVSFEKIQIITLIKYAGKSDDDIADEGETTVVDPEGEDGEGGEDLVPEPAKAAPKAPARPAAPAAPKAPARPATKKTDKDPLY